MEFSGHMLLDVELSGGGAVELCGTRVKYWVGCGLPDYEGEIEGLPDMVLSELLKLGAVRAVV